MPEGMSKERYQRIRQYGGELDLTPGSESDVILVLERTEHYKKDPKNKVLAQFELLPNYRFHRYVTGRSAIEAAQPYGNGRIAAFVSAPGSAGTIAAGDEIKAAFPECRDLRRSSPRNAPPCSTTAAARTASKASATRWSPSSTTCSPPTT